MYICIDCKTKGEGRSDRKRCARCKNAYKAAKSKAYEAANQDVRLETYKRYRSSELYRERAKARYYSKPEDQRKAHYTVTNAVRDGKLTRPAGCARCGLVDTGVKRSMLEAHHHRGYKPEHWLDVEWLCTPCHKLADRKEV